MDAAGWSRLHASQAAVKHGCLQEGARRAEQRGAWVLWGYGATDVAQAPLRILSGVFRGLATCLAQQPQLRDQILVSWILQIEKRWRGSRDWNSIFGQPTRQPQARHGVWRATIVASADDLMQSAGNSRAPCHHPAG